MSKTFSDMSMLVRLKNPTDGAYEITHETKELTFLGRDKQPDFAQFIIYFYPKCYIIELKSLKKYLYQFRTKVLSYERLINVMYDDLMTFYKPYRLRTILKIQTRGGLRSRLVIDSDWEIRGGQEKFKDWLTRDE